MSRVSGVLLVGILGVVGAFCSAVIGFGWLSIGLLECTVAVVILASAPRRPWTWVIVGGVLVVLLALAAQLALTATSVGVMGLPEMFSTPSRRLDIACGSVVAPGPDDHLGCASWRTERAVEGAALVGLALIAGASTVAGVLRSRARERSGRRDAQEQQAGTRSGSRTPAH